MLIYLGTNNYSVLSEMELVKKQQQILLFLAELQIAQDLNAAFVCIHLRYR